MNKQELKTNFNKYDALLRDIESIKDQIESATETKEFLESKMKEGGSGVEALREELLPELIEREKKIDEFKVELQKAEFSKKGIERKLIRVSHRVFTCHSLEGALLERVYHFDFGLSKEL